MYDINGFTFCVNSKDKKSAAQNSGIHYDALDENGEYTRIMASFMKYGN